RFLLKQPDSGPLAPADRKEASILIDGGKGVGRVTRPGLDQPVGEAAINHVPREMILKEVKEVCALFDFHGSLSVTISIPEGETLAKKTFNPRLGIQGGISVLGTTGVVEPMSAQALIDTIRIELSVLSSEGKRICAISPGNYGQDFMKSAYGFDLDSAVKCSNFIGETFCFLPEYGFEEILFCGHIGKLVKLYGGMFNTHSHEGDCRMELLASAALRRGVDADTAREVLAQISTTAALEILQKRGCLQDTMEEILRGVMETLERWADQKYKVECVIYETSFGELAKTSGAAALIEKLTGKAEKEEKSEDQEAAFSELAKPSKASLIGNQTEKPVKEKKSENKETAFSELAKPSEASSIGKQTEKKAKAEESGNQEAAFKELRNTPEADDPTEKLTEKTAEKGKLADEEVNHNNIMLTQNAADPQNTTHKRVEIIPERKASPAILCFTREGLRMAEKVRETLGEGQVYIKSKTFDSEKEEGNFIKVSESLTAWCEQRFLERAPIIFIGAIGIAVRGVAGSVNNKLEDPPVIVLDEKG
ncbi:MAG: cobalamin biosynthesis protein CbiD, partial [Lachnospiraceae bacterium]|nr:cobalamin biosynthesis protein CbiD [Lachnospiraceae bacterium]